MIEILGSLGFDGAWIETEHGPFDYRDLPDLTRACDLWGMTSVVRVALNLPGVIYRTLDVGAQGIVVPHVDTVDDARAVVDAGKFAPIGHRGNYTSRQGIGVDDYLTQRQRRDAPGRPHRGCRRHRNLDEILTVDNIDVFFVAPGDLSQSMGISGGMNNPEVQTVVDDAVQRIIAAGRVAGSLASTDTVEATIEKGARFLLTNWDPWVATGARHYLGRVDKAS